MPSAPGEKLSTKTTLTNICLRLTICDYLNEFSLLNLGASLQRGG